MLNLKVFNERITLPKCESCNGDRLQRDSNGQIIQLNGRDLKCNCYYANKFLEANIGFKYWFISPETFEGEEEDLNRITKYFNKIHELKTDGRGFYIYGPNFGTGKTTISVMLLMHILLNTDYSCLFVPFSDLVILNTKLINGSFDKIVDEKIDIIKNVHFLVLDDLAKEYDNQKDNGRATLNSILRFRDLWNLPTIYTSNVPMDKVEELYGGSNYSIINGNSITINMVNKEDFRRNMKIKHATKERKIS